MGKPTAIQKTEKIVEDCESDLNKLWILDMFATNISKNNVTETAQRIFNEEMDLIVDNIEAELEVTEMAEMEEEIKEDLQIGEAIRANIAKVESDRIKSEIRNRVEDATKTTREGIHLLSLYLRDDFDQFQTHVARKGFERTWETLSGDEVDLDDLVEKGLLYKKHQSDNTRSFWNYVVPHYSLELLEELVEESSKLDISLPEPSENEIREKIEEKEAKEFVKWLQGTSKYIKESTEEKQVEKELENKEIDLSLDEFKEIREELVKGNILIYDYSPKRDSSKNNNEKPATWKYELTRPVINSVPILRWRPEEFYNI